MKNVQQLMLMFQEVDGALLTVLLDIRRQWIQNVSPVPLVRSRFEPLLSADGALPFTDSVCG